MLPNFTLVDVIGITAASLVLTGFVFVPGYVAGWLTNACGFRSRSLLTQTVLSTPLGVAVFPIVVYLAGEFTPALWILIAIVWGAFAILVAREVKRRTSWMLSRELRIGAALVLVWAALAVASLADLQLGDRLYFNVSAYDHCVRAAFTAAAARNIPPGNPFFGANPPVLLRYHYFWMIVCGLASRVAGLTPRYALYGGTVWSGIALMSLVAAGLKFFYEVKEQLRRKVLIGIGLLTVTGLDILPVLYTSHFKAPRYPDMEWWNVQITSWLDALLWAPHHLMALVACLIGFMVLRQAASSRFQRAVNIAVCGFAFASASGLSALVTFTFAVFVVFWLVVSAVRRWWDEVALLVAASAVAFILAWPYLRQLLAPGLDGGFVRFGVREFPLALRMIAKHTGWNISPTIPDLLLLPLNYFFELGFFLLIAVLRFKAVRQGRVRLAREETAAWTMVATSFLIGSFLQSTTLVSNDLGWRCFLQAQFVFLLWAALLLNEWWPSAQVQPSRRTRRVAWAMLILGVLGTAYQVVTLRVYPMLHDQGIVNGPDWLDADRKLGMRTYALRSVYDRLSATLPLRALVQYNPVTPAYIPHLLYSGHPAAEGLPQCGVVFGGELSRCEPRMNAIQPLFGNRAPTDMASVAGVCERYGITVVVATDSDPAWADAESWIWRGTPVLANEHVRAFRCGH